MGETVTGRDLVELERRLMGRFDNVDRAIGDHHSMAKSTSDSLVDHAKRQTAIMEETLRSIRLITGINWLKIARTAAFLLLAAVALGIVLGRLGIEGLSALVDILGKVPGG